VVVNDVSLHNETQQVILMTVLRFAMLLCKLAKQPLNHG